MTRDYRALTYWFRMASRLVSKFTSDPLEALGVKVGLIKRRQKTLVWTKAHTHDPPMTPKRPAPQHVASPTIELTLYSDSLYDEGSFHDTPAMAHSRLPPAHTTRCTLSENDASFTEPTLPIYEQYRTSDDSNWIPIQRPTDVHRSRAASSEHSRRHSHDRRHSSDLADPRSSSEYLLSPTSLPTDQSAYGGWPSVDATVQSRHGYRRANSDPKSPSAGVVQERERGGLRIELDTERREREACQEVEGRQ
jgi:hypothetical protein